MTALAHRIRARKVIARMRAEAPVRAVERVGRIAARSARLRALAPATAERDALLGRASAGAVFGALAMVTTADGARALPAAALGLLIGWRIGVAVHERASHAARAEARRALPWVLDRLSTCVLAGMSVERALRAVTPGTPGLLGDAFAAGLRALDLGVPRARAYDRIADRAGLEEVRALMVALARAERFGVSVSDTLVAQSAELRARARAAAEAEARTAPIKLLFPLVFCFLPAFVLLTIAPIALSAIRTLGSL